MKASLTAKQTAAWGVIQDATPLAEDQIQRLTESELDLILKATSPARVRAVLADAYVRYSNAARAEAQKALELR